jgi:cytoskeletal protein RodZ
VLKLLAGPVVSKVLLGLVAILLAVAVIQTLRVSWGQNKQEALTAQLRTVKADNVALTKARHSDEVATASKTASVASIRKQANATTKKLEVALSVDPDWAEQPIPDDVARLLRDGAVN